MFITDVLLCRIRIIFSLIFVANVSIKYVSSRNCTKYVFMKMGKPSVKKHLNAHSFTVKLAGIKRLIFADEQIQSVR